MTDTSIPDPPASEDAPLGDRTRWVGDTVLAARGKARILKVRARANPAGDGYALKELKKQPSTTAVRRFEREVEVTRSLSRENPGVVPVLDYYVPRDGEVSQPWYVMPLAESSLERAPEYEFDLLAVLQLGQFLAHTLAAAHKAGVIHRDLKPANLLRMSGSTVQIADFGIAYLGDEAERFTGDLAHTVGTRPFVAPELITRGPAPVTTAVDVYSLGKTLYALLAGGAVFEREDHRAGEYDLTVKTGDSAFEHFHALLDRMVATEPSERFQDMHAVGTALERAIIAVKAGAVFEPGMYGTSATPIAGYRTLLGTLTSQTVRKRRVRANAIDQAVDAARAHIAATAPPGTRPAEANDPGDDAAAIAEECGEFLLGAGAAALVAEDDELVHEWVARLTTMLEGEASRMNRRDLILHEAAAYALIAVGGMAWKHGSLGCLRAVVDAYKANASSIIYLPLVTGADEPSARWLAKAIGQSGIVADAEPWVGEQAELVVGLVSGFALLRYLGWMPAAERARLHEHPSDFDGYPALREPYWTWFSEVGRRCREKPGLAQRLGEALAVTSEGDLAKACARLHPLLMRLVRARRAGRSSFFVGSVDPSGDWRRWLNVGD